MRKMQQQRMAQAAALTLPKPKPQPPQPQALPVEVEVRKVGLEPSDDDDDEEEEEEEEEEASEPEREELDEEEIDEKLDLDHPEDEEPLYENITPCNCKVEPQHSDLEDLQDKRSQFRKRSVSLDDDDTAGAPPPSASGLRLPSTPASPCREDLLLANVSTYPSSDSLANDNTRDHSDGIWNESQVTVLTAEQRDISDGSYSSNLVLTPSSKRKNLLLQHQQRSSVDTDALDFEEQVGISHWFLDSWIVTERPLLFSEPHLWLTNTAKDCEDAHANYIATRLHSTLDTAASYSCHTLNEPYSTCSGLLHKLAPAQAKPGGQGFGSGCSPADF
ncbi:hypothetical protein KR054_004376 [Drosophila jambulina]|nr:hypothetical protein KR054_004376 [Drosophila jambulina]